MYFNYFAIPVYISVLVLFLIFSYSVKNRPGKHMYYFILFNFAATFYSFFYALEISTNSIEYAYLFYRLQYLGIPYITSFFLLFVLIFTGRTWLFRKKIVWVIYIVPILISILVFTNSLHHFFIKDFTFNYEGAFPISNYEKNWGYWLSQFIQLLYMTIALIIMIKNKRESSIKIKKQVNILLIASLIPFFFYILYLVHLIPWGMDPVPFAFLFGSLVIFFGLSQNALLKSDEVYRTAIFDNINSAIILTDENDRILDFNSMAEQHNIVSYAQKELDAGKTLFFWHDYKKCKTIGNFKSYFNDSAKTYDINYSIINDSSGKAVGKMFIITDITDQIKAQEALNITSENYKDIVDNASDMIHSIDKDGRILFTNSAWLKTLGYTEAEALKMNIKQIIDKGQHDYCENILEKVHLHGVEKNIKTVFIKKTGEKVWVEGNLNIRNENGIYRGTRGIFRDISDRVLFEKSRANKLMILQTISESMDDLIKTSNYSNVLYDICKRLGQATEVDRVYVFKNDYDSTGNPVSSTSQICEWNSGFAGPQINNPELQRLKFDSVPDFIEPLRNFQPYKCLVNNLNNGNTKRLFESQSIKSVLALPLKVGGQFWGLIGFDYCKYEREWTEVDYSMLKSFADSLSGAIERFELVEKLNKSVEIAQKATEAKSEFLAHMSHELRTPLNAIVGYSELLLRKNTDKSIKDQLNSINSSAIILLEIINDILDFSRLDADKLEIYNEELNIKILIDQIRQLIEYKIEEKKIKFNIEIDADVPEIIYVDIYRLRQILINLLGNAVKFTEIGEIRLQIQTLEITENYCKLKFIVSDTGIGISESKINKIIESFTQADRSITSKYGGSGLGLAISQKLLQLMGSKLELFSELGKGSNFMFTLFCSNFDENRAGKSKNVESVNSKNANKHEFSEIFNFKTVMIVEDNQTNMILAKQLLNIIIPDSEILEAEDGSIAIDLFIKKTPDLIFMDIHMPGISGFDTANAIRKLENGKDCLIIALTAGTMANEKELSLQNGMDDYLSKPVRLEKIREVLRKHLKKNEL